MSQRIVIEIARTLFTTLISIGAYWGMLAVLNWALQYRWFFLCVTLPYIGLLLGAGLWGLRSQGASVSDAIIAFSMTLFAATLGFGALSLWLATVGWAKYTPENLNLVSYSNYYWWQFLELIPVLQVNYTLGLVAPLQPEGLVARLLVLGFRIFILFGLLKALRVWWNRRKEKTDDWAISQSAV